MERPLYIMHQAPGPGTGYGMKMIGKDKFHEEKDINQEKTMDITQRNKCKKKKKKKKAKDKNRFEEFGKKERDPDSLRMENTMKGLRIKLRKLINDNKVLERWDWMNKELLRKLYDDTYKMGCEIKKKDEIIKIYNEYANIEGNFVTIKESKVKEDDTEKIRRMDIMIRKYEIENGDKLMIRKLKNERSFYEKEVWRKYGTNMDYQDDRDKIYTETDVINMEKLIRKLTMNEEESVIMGLEKDKKIKEMENTISSLSNKMEDMKLV